MKIDITTKPSLEELNTFLSKEFPEYDVKIRRGYRKFVQVKKSAFIGAWIHVNKKNKLVVTGGIPANIVRGIFGHIFQLFILKPLKAMEEEVALILEDEYGDAQFINS